MLCSEGILDSKIEIQNWDSERELIEVAKQVNKKAEFCFPVTRGICTCQVLSAPLSTASSQQSADKAHALSQCGNVPLTRPLSFYALAMLPTSGTGVTYKRQATGEARMGPLGSSQHCSSPEEDLEPGVTPSLWASVLWANRACFQDFLQLWHSGILTVACKLS